MFIENTKSHTILNWWEKKVQINISCDFKLYFLLVVNDE